VGCEQSPSVLEKIVEASIENRSYERASRELSKLAEVEIPAKQCERVTQRIGSERVAEQQEEVDRYSRLTLPEQMGGCPPGVPENFWESRAAVVELDGGRMQIRDERWGTPYQAGEARRHWWRETKAGCLMTFASRSQAEDPLPDLPASLRDPLFAVPRFAEMKRGRGQGAEASESDGAVKPTAPPRHVQSEDFPPWSPEPLVRSMVASCGSYEQLAERLRAAAWQRGFARAQRKAFLGDGLPVNWTIHQQYFSHYVPIVDLMHALSYVYIAAIAASRDFEEGWRRYEGWAEAVWQGRVDAVVEQLEQLQVSATEANAAELQRSLGYLKNNAARMRYHEYRQGGLPITTAHIESINKQLNRRVKGTERFWSRPGGEPVLQLCADAISETEPLDTFWKQRSARAIGFRKYRAGT
jgi:hypothetical protein